MRIANLVPNTVTSMNLLCGAVGVIFTLSGRPDIAFPLMIAAAVADFFDGFAARLLGAYSETGKELDSLADDISFGLLPALMLFRTMQDNGHEYVCYIPLLIAVFSALRLAKFNIDERQHESFLGLPTPACAMLCGSLAYFVAHHPDSLLASACSLTWFIPLLSILLSALLVSEIPMFSMKSGKNTDKRTKGLRITFLAFAVIAAIVTAAAGKNWSLIVFAAFSFYILLNLGASLFNKKQ